MDWTWRLGDGRFTFLCLLFGTFYFYNCELPGQTINRLKSGVKIKKKKVRMKVGHVFVENKMTGKNAEIF